MYFFEVYPKVDNSSIVSILFDQSMDRVVRVEYSRKVYAHAHIVAFTQI